MGTSHALDCSQAYLRWVRDSKLQIEHSQEEKRGPQGKCRLGIGLTLCEHGFLSCDNRLTPPMSITPQTPVCSTVSMLVTWVCIAFGYCDSSPRDRAFTQSPQCPTNASLIVRQLRMDVSKSWPQKILFRVYPHMPPTPAGNAQKHNAQNRVFAKSSRRRRDPVAFKQNAHWVCVQSTIGCRMFPLSLVSTCQHRRTL